MERKLPIYIFFLDIHVLHIHYMAQKINLPYYFTYKMVYKAEKYMFLKQLSQWDRG